jgi:hypothetical protein
VRRASLDADGVELARRSVELPPEFFENQDACEAVRRAAASERLWPMFAMGKGAAKALVGNIKLDGASVREEDAEGWRHISAVVAHTTRRREASARWHSFALEVGEPACPNPKFTVDFARSVIRAADNAYAHGAQLSGIVCGIVALEHLSDDPDLCRSLADQIRAAAPSRLLMRIPSCEAIGVMLGTMPRPMPVWHLSTRGKD